MLEITEKINWTVLESWVGCCANLKTSLLHGQVSGNPNIHHCVLDLMVMLTDLRPLAEQGLEGDQNEIVQWARCEILGICHKCLRALDVPHFAGCLLNPGVGYIPDLNDFLP